MFQCSQCDKAYQRKAHLQRHELTHTGQATSACPFCRKAFLIPYMLRSVLLILHLTHLLYREVARRHSKKCAIVHNQQPAPASRPGRKRSSCDHCFSRKRACDGNSPCSRCHSIGLDCTFDSQKVVSRASPADVSLSLSSQPPPSTKNDSQFSFLRHFTDPCVEKDRLAISTTAESSIRRNLETLYSHLEDALIPLDSMSSWLDGLSGAGAFFQPPMITDDFISSDFFTSGPSPTKLSGQLDELMLEVIETSKSMEPKEPGNLQPLPDAAQLASLFTVSNIGIFISVFFHSLYWHLPVVHFPTFDPGNISNPLLLSVILAGATYSGTFNAATQLPAVLDVAEEYIFRKVTALSSHSAMPSKLTQQEGVIQLIQAALIMEMLQFGQERVETRRRIRVIRHPSLVSLMRYLGIFQLKRSNGRTTGEDDDNTWRALVAQEVCVRLASWVYLADGFLTLYFRNRPAISIFEMDCSFPWRTELWEAEDATTFNRIAAGYQKELPLPSIREAVRLLLENSGAGPVPSRLSLSAENLLIIIYALNSLAFKARVDFFGSIPLEKIKRAANSWKQIWDVVSADNEQKLHLGYPKHAEELWLLLTATLDLAEHGTDLPYLDISSAATDDLGKLNEFIQWCTRHKKTPDALAIG
ncbi:hypothetical protein BJX70DRAFT_96057 [Aspergillus crustosus]